MEDYDSHSNSYLCPFSGKDSDSWSDFSPLEQAKDSYLRSCYNRDFVSCHYHPYLSLNPYTDF